MFALALLVGCGDGTSDTTAEAKTDSTETYTAKPDMAQLKQEIQERETAWSQADNARDADAVAAFYADDAVTMEADKPMIEGKSAIKKNVEEYIGKRPDGSTLKYEAIEVFGDDHCVTEVGKTTRMDKSGKTVGTGKYMAIWEKRDGKWVCIRDIGNDDKKMN